MATMKKSRASKAPKKTMMKRPSAKKAPQQMQQQAPPAPMQQAPQPPMGTPAPGSNGPMMKKGGVIKKKAQGGTSLTRSMPSLGAYKVGGKMKKAQNSSNLKDKNSSEYPMAERGLAERAGPMFKTKTKVRSDDGYYVTKSVTTNKPNSSNSTNKTRRTLQGYLAGAPRVNDLKNGGKMKKAQGGSSLGMKSVKSGYDNNSGVTRADFVAIGKGKAKSGTKMKMGGKMKTCKGGC